MLNYFQKWIVLGSVTSMSGIVLYICVRKFKKSSTIKDEAKHWNIAINEVLFFPDKGFPCKQYLLSKFGCQKRDCKYLHEETSLSKLCSYLDQSKISIDACLFILTNKDLTICLMNACKRGVKVRILIDATMAQSEGRRLKELRDKGVFVCEAETRYLIHHKFAVVDSELVITGSYNWTAQATLGNWDNVLVSSEKKLVQPYVQQFVEMWKEFTELHAPRVPVSANYPFLRKSAWEGIIIGHQAPNC